MNKDDIINDIVSFVYYLEDKIDPVYLKEVTPRIVRFVERVKKNLK